MTKNSTIEAQIEYGLNEIADKDRPVELPLKDMLYLHQTIGELIRFFHQQKHFPDIQSVEKFMGDAKEGAFSAVNRCYYEILADCWPDDVVEGFDNGDFDNPEPPAYFDN